MSTRLAAIVFDMDGVLIDSEPLHFGVLTELFAQDGFAYTREENEQFLGTTTEAFFAELIARHRLPASIPEYVKRYDDGILRVLRQPQEPRPGVLSLIDRARELELRLAVASSSRMVWIEATLHALGLTEAFDAIVSGDDVRHGKPDPEIYLLAARRLGVPPGACLAIEDAPNGITSAGAAGMQVIGVRTPYTAHLSLEGAHVVVDSLVELDLQVALS